MPGVPFQIVEWLAPPRAPLYHRRETDENGRFTIEGLPPGEYTPEAWHEKLGDQRAVITVNASGSAEVSFTFKAKAQ